MIKSPQIILFLGSLVTLIFTNCSKKETLEVDNESQSVVDYAIADQEFMGLISAASIGALQFTVTGVQNFTHIINAQSMPDGKERSGRINISRITQSKTPGSQMVFKMDNCWASAINYTCDSIIVTTTESNNDFTNFHVVLVNGSCKTSDFTIKYKFDRTFILYANGDSGGSYPLTYVYGSASGTNRSNGGFSTSVAQGTWLVKRANCAYINSGTMELTPDGFKTRTINFGDGTCDDQATFTVKENTVAFKLK
ncbi:hypothetical protein [Aurantibacillus circumpalustris]|uniref:hypothetical protein n=1 Tax=Aurantibacillus circumpalustris TaxID=3036359 RepID=UPI00295B9131|nr:hypothetical protein [Aurantibacillus circumpalustris]